MVKIPFEKRIAIDTLNLCDLFIELSSLTGSLTTDELYEIKNKFKKMYYNNKVELLEVVHE